MAEVGFASGASVAATRRATIATKSKSSASATTAYDVLLWVVSQLYYKRVLTSPKFSTLNLVFYGTAAAALLNLLNLAISP